jgi:hypothetical protein
MTLYKNLLLPRCRKTLQERGQKVTQGAGGSLSFQCKAEQCLSPSLKIKGVARHFKGDKTDL